MNKKILNILNTAAGQLIFALLAGGGYFMVLLKFIIELSKGQWLLAFFVAPMIICGAALIIVKLMKQARENENEGAILKLFWLHAVLIVIGVIFVAAL